MRIDVPYFSQHKDVALSEWRERSCGIACIKMLIDYWHGDFVTLDALIEEGVAIGAYSAHGWIHDGLVALLHNRGVGAYREEFKSVKFDQEIFEIGIQKIVAEILINRPVIISAVKNFSEDNKFHMVVLLGVEKDEIGKVKGFIYHDPDAETEDRGANLYVDISTFRSKWRKFAIFSYK